MRFLLIATLLLAGGPAREWAKDVPFTRKWSDAIRTARSTGRILCIFNGYEDEGVNARSDGLRNSIRGLAKGVKGYRKYKTYFQKYFVFLCEFCTSAKKEKGPRGPKGPYRFEADRIPVVVLKRWNGETLAIRIGFPSDDEEGMKVLAKMVDEAMAKNGPVIAPKHLKPLAQADKKAAAHLKKERWAPAIRLLQGIVKSGANTKKFPDGPPPVAVAAAKRLTELEERALQQLDDANLIDDPAEARKAYVRVRQDFGALPRIAKEIKAALKALEGG